MSASLDTNETEELRTRLAEAEDTLRAIHNGEVDAFVVSGPHGNQIYTLRGEETAYRILVEAMNEGALVLTQNGTVTYCNSRFAQMLDVPLQQVIGSRIQRFVVDSDARAIEELLIAGSRSESRRELTLRHRSTGEKIPTQVSVASLPMEDAPGISAVVTNLTEQKRVEAELDRYRLHLEDLVRERTQQLNESEIALRESLVALVASEEHLRLATEGGRIGTWSWNIAEDHLVCSDSMMAMRGRLGVQPTGFEGFLDNVHPEDRGKKRSALKNAVANRSDYDIELRVVWPDGSVHWLSERGRPHYDREGACIRMEGAGIDITERKTAEQELRARAEREAALNRISEAIRQTQDLQEVQTIALDALAHALKADRSAVLLMDGERNSIKVAAEWRWPHLPEMRGRYSVAELEGDLAAKFPHMQSLVVPNIESDGVTHRSAEMWRSLQIAAVLEAPISIDGKVTGVVGVFASEAPRYWTREEIGFVEAVASQLRAAMESSRILADAEGRAEREALISRIGEVMRASFDPTEIQKCAVSMLAEALGADRCYVAIYDLDRAIITVENEWHRPDLPPAVGEYTFPNTVEMFHELYKSTGTSAIPDRDRSGLSEQTVRNMLALSLRSRLSVAIASVRGIVTLTVAMSDRARDWTNDDVEILERVATQLRSTVELARAQQRERRIARDLQDALLPEMPRSIPGLKLACTMQPALEEAGIGGDFCDVFPLVGDLYALVIGDVSGKGLAAAAQLALIRNSLRMTLYLFHSPADCLARLNAVLSAQGLLIGFVTVFVGIYNAATGSVVYSSAGHEPGLVLRGDDGRIETLAMDGPPLGVEEKVDYTDWTIELVSGDTIFLYTDGLSEAGPSRQELLGTDGLIHLLASTEHPNDLDGSIADIIGRAHQFANNVFRDDVCVLMARRVDDFAR